MPFIWCITLWNFENGSSIYCKVIQVWIWDMYHVFWNRLQHTAWTNYPSLTILVALTDTTIILKRCYTVYARVDASLIGTVLDSEIHCEFVTRKQHHHSYRGPSFIPFFRQKRFTRYKKLWKHLLTIFFFISQHFENPKQHKIFDIWKVRRFAENA